MINHINSTNLDVFIQRSSAFTTGGGLDVKRQLHSLRNIRSVLDVPLLQPAALSDHDYVCSVTEIGNPEAPPIQKEKLMPEMLRVFETISGKKIKGFFPPEVGQESILLESAHYAQLPLIDFDPVGFRAVPFVDISIFRLINKSVSFTPAVIATDYGEIISLSTPITYDRAEQIIRTMTTFSEHGCVLVLGEMKAVSEIKQLAKKNRYSYQQILYSKAAKLENILYKERYIVVEKEEFEHTGFYCEILTIQSKNSGKKHTLCILNEAVLLFNEERNLLYAVPERILLLNDTEDSGIATVDLSVGLSFRLCVMSPEPQWSTKEAQQLFGSERFSFFKGMIK